MFQILHFVNDDPGVWQGTCRAGMSMEWTMLSKRLASPIPHVHGLGKICSFYELQFSHLKYAPPSIDYEVHTNPVAHAVYVANRKCPIDISLASDSSPVLLVSLPMIYIIHLFFIYS